MDNNKLKNINIMAIILIIVLAIFLFFKGSKDNVTIKLKGNEQITIKQYEQYIEHGYEIVNGKEKGYYVNIDGFVNNSQIGRYVLNYNLYNKSGNLVSSATRVVIVIENDLSSIDLILNGESVEYYFVGDYTDKGVIAYDGSNDISNSVIVDTNLNQNVPGKYIVKYQIKRNNAVKELNREVYIVDFDVKENILSEKKVINLIISCDNYAYTLLPDGSREYSKDIEYEYSESGSYNFDIYLKSGSHKKYSVNLKNVDKDKFNGTCSLYFQNNTTKITVNMKDESLVSKYSYNGLEFYGNTKVVNGYIGNVTIRAYDYLNDSIDIKCKNTLDYGFKQINNNKSGFITCGADISMANKELEAIVQSYGYKTREAVAAAGIYLANYKYNIPYFWGGKSIVKGIDNTWGCRKNHTTEHKCSVPLNSDRSYCQYGLDCAGFTRWAFIQAGFDNSILRGSSQTEGNWGNFNALSHRYAFNSSNTLFINQIKPGDIVHKPGHVGLVIGVDKDTLQIAEMTGPINIDIINKSNGISINSHSSFTDFVLFDEFYKMYGN